MKGMTGYISLAITTIQLAYRSATVGLTTGLKKKRPANEDHWYQDMMYNLLKG
jgi:hypothetical protein